MVCFAGYVLAFNVSVSKTMNSLARIKGVTIISHNVIYKLMDLLKVCVCVFYTAVGRPLRVCCLDSRPLKKTLFSAAWN